MTSGYPDSYYAATATAWPPHPPLKGDVTTDVCVVGAGYTGLSAAIHLAERGYSVTLLEAERVGFGASGRNGGQLGTGQRKDQRTLEEKYGKEWAHRLWSLAEDSVATVKGLIADHNIQCDLTPGVIMAAWKAGEVDWMKEEVDHMASEYGYEKLKFIPQKEMREQIGTTRYHAGLLDKGAAHLHPLNYALGIAKAAEAKGVKIYENTPVTKITDTDPAKVHTKDGTVTARFVVVATNGYLKKLEPRMARLIMPINNFIIATEPLSDNMARALIRDNVAVLGPIAAREQLYVRDRIEGQLRIRQVLEQIGDIETVDVIGVFGNRRTSEGRQVAKCRVAAGRAGGQERHARQVLGHRQRPKLLGGVHGRGLRGRDIDRADRRTGHDIGPEFHRAAGGKIHRGTNAWAHDHRLRGLADSRDLIGARW